MALPNPGMNFTPFDVLPASDLNDLVENIDALAAGTGLNAGVVTPSKRSGGFKVGSFTPSAGTGNKSVTGVGFQPKGVMFFSLRANTTVEGIFSGGAYDGSSQFTSAMGARITATAGNYTTSSTTACVRVTTFTTGAENILMQASGVSLDADGFTLNFTTNGTASPVGYIAFA